jgi:hypothetical protein
MPADPFTINLNDPADLVVKHGEATKILEVKQQRLAELRDVEREVRKWQSTVDFIASQLPEDALRVDTRKFYGGGTVVAHGHAVKSFSQANGNRYVPRPGDLAVEVVNREVRKIRSIEVRDILAQEGHDLDPQAVSNALHYAAHEAKKIKVAEGRGMYAPLAYDETEPPSPTAPSATAPQAQTADAMASRREDWSGGRHPPTPSTG